MFYVKVFCSTGIYYYFIFIVFILSPIVFLWLLLKILFFTYLCRTLMPCSILQHTPIFISDILPKDLTHFSWMISYCKTDVSCIYCSVQTPFISCLDHWNRMMTNNNLSLVFFSEHLPSTWLEWSIYIQS